MPLIINLQVGGKQFSSADCSTFPPLESAHNARFEVDDKTFRLRVLDAGALRFEASYCPSLSQLGGRLTDAWNAFLECMSAVFSGADLPRIDSPFRPFTDSTVSQQLHNWASSNRNVATFDAEASKMVDLLLQEGTQDGRGGRRSAGISDREGNLIIDSTRGVLTINSTALRNWLEERVWKDPCNRLIKLTPLELDVLRNRYRSEVGTGAPALIKSALLNVVIDAQSESETPLAKATSFREWVNSLPTHGKAFTDDQIDAMGRFLHSKDLEAGEGASEEHQEEVERNVARYRMQFISLFPDLIRLHRMLDSTRLTREMHDNPCESARPGGRMMDLAQPQWNREIGGERLVNSEGRLRDMAEPEGHQYQMIINSNKPEDIYTQSLIVAAREFFWRIGDLQRTARAYPTGKPANPLPRDGCQAEQASMIRFNIEAARLDAAALVILRQDTNIRAYLVKEADRLIREGLTQMDSVQQHQDSALLRPSELEGIKTPALNGVAELLRAGRIVRAIPEEMF